MKRITLFLASAVLLVSACTAEGTKGQTLKSPRPVTSMELEKLMASDDKPLLVDVRTEAEYAEGHIPGAILFPYDELESRKADFAKLAPKKDLHIVVYCRSGRRSEVAASTLAKLGYTNISDAGAISSWKGKLAR